MTTEPTPIHPEQSWAQPAPPPYYYPPRPPAPPTSGNAVASMVLSIVGITVGWVMLGFPAILGVVFGHTALSNDIAKKGMGGRGMAIAGLAIGYVVIGIMALVFLSVVLS